MAFSWNERDGLPPEFTEPIHVDDTVGEGGSVAHMFYGTHEGNFMAHNGCPVSHRFDPFEDFYLDDPYAVFRQFRNAAPISFVPELDAYVITRYDDIVDVFKDRETFTSEGATSNFFSVCPEAQSILESGFPRKPTFTNCDPPHHTLMRATAARCLTPRRWAQSQPAVREYAGQLVDHLVQKPQADLQTDLAYPLPAFAGFALLGFPTEDTDMLKEWCVERLLLTYGHLEPDAQIEAARKVVDFWDYSRAHVLNRIAEPADDLTSDLIAAANESAGAVTIEDVVNMVYSIALASHETTQNAMLNGLRRLLEHRDQWELLCAEPGLIPQAVEELLRFDAPVMSLRRRAARSVEIGGVRIPQGARILIVTASANRDPGHFDNPEALDLRRANAREHLTFGKQWHFCLGSPLARFEYGVVLENLTKKAPRMRLVPGQAFKYLPIVQFRAMKALLVEPDPSAV